MTTELTLIENLIHEIRGYKVILDSDLARLYEVETRRLNEAVKRNIERFPAHFMFQLTKEEYTNLISHFATSSWGGVRKMPYVFTEQGVAMLSSVLKSKKAIQINIQIMDTFVKIRQFALENTGLSKRLTKVEQYLINYCKENEADKQEIYKAIDLLLDRTKPVKVGFIKET